jgi:hypothetical protein
MEQNLSIYSVEYTNGEWKFTNDNKESPLLALKELLYAIIIHVLEIHHNINREKKTNTASIHLIFCLLLSIF